MKIKFVIIGHIAYNKDVTPFGVKVSLGGGAYYAAVGATAANSNGVGVIAAVGNDFDLTKLRGLKINTNGVHVITNKETAKFTITQSLNGTRTFHAIWGTSENAYLNLFPQEYSEVEYVHLATAPPKQQLAWIKMLRKYSSKIFISIDTFEKFARDYPSESKEVINTSDFVFINQEEALLLDFENSTLSKKPYILKMGSKGAKFCDNRQRFHITAPFSTVVDTTGAGDILAGAFFAQVSNGSPVRESLYKSIHLASLSVQKFGADHLLNHCNYFQEK